MGFIPSDVKKNVTPNQVLLMFGIKNGVTTPPKDTRLSDKNHLVSIGFLQHKNGVYLMTAEAKAFCVRLDNYFIKAKKENRYRTYG